MTDGQCGGADAAGPPAELHAFVHETLCARENLVPELFTTHATTLVQGRRPCGARFELRGLRDVVLSAVWAEPLGVVYFYDARGERFARERFVASASGESRAA